MELVGVRHNYQPNLSARIHCLVTELSQLSAKPISENTLSCHRVIIAIIEIYHWKCSVLSQSCNNYQPNLSLEIRCPVTELSQLSAKPISQNVLSCYRVVTNIISAPIIHLSSTVCEGWRLSSTFYQRETANHPLLFSYFSYHPVFTRLGAYHPVSFMF